MRNSCRILLAIAGFVLVFALAGCKVNSGIGSVNDRGQLGSGEGIAPCDVSLLHGLDPVVMFQNGRPLPCPDHDNDDILNECDVDLTLGEDCNSNGIDDSCEQDTDFDTIIDDCDEDIDGDLIPNDCDIDQTMGIDCDLDGQDDSCELDTDNDLVIDDCDSDDDNDGDSDSQEEDCGSDPLDSNDVCFDCTDLFNEGYDQVVDGFNTSEFDTAIENVVTSLLLDCNVIDVSTLTYEDLVFLSDLEEFLSLPADPSSEDCIRSGQITAVFDMLLVTLRAEYLATVEDMDGDLVQDRCDDDIDGDGVDGACDEDDEDNTNTTDTCVATANCYTRMLGQQEVIRKGYFTIDGVDYRIELNNFSWDNRGFYTPSRAFVKVDGQGSAQKTKFTINWNQNGNLYLGNLDLASGQGNVAIWQAVSNSFFCFNNDCRFRLQDGSVNPDLDIQIDWRN